MHVAGIDGKHLGDGALGVLEMTRIDGMLRAREMGDKLAEDGGG